MSQAIIASFCAAMRKAGLAPVFRPGEGIEFGHDSEGRPRRFHVDGDDKGTRNGWYILFGDGVPAGEFGSWKTGQSVPWCAKDSTSLTPEERRELDARIEAERKKRDKEQRRREGEAAKQANLIWNEACAVEGDSHPYLRRKGIRSHGLRVTSWPLRNSEGETYRCIDDTLVIPIIDRNGKIVSLQGVFPSTDEALGRDKAFLRGGRKSGCFFMIGRPPIAGGTVAFCEGYGTGESIHQATGWCVIVCWDAYNIPKVAKHIREAMPQQVFVFCADNDQWTTKPVNNPGVTYARRAASEVSGRVVVPEFASLDGKPTDFNDLHAREGIERVQAQVLPSTLPAPTDDEGREIADTSGAYMAPSCAVDFDTMTPFPEFDGKGKPLPTARNLAELCRRVAARVRYNVIKKEIEVLVPGLSTSIDNAKEASYNELFNCLHRVRMSTAGFEGNLCSVADANQFNPVATWVQSRPWDGTSRLQMFFDTVRTKNDTELPDGTPLKDLLLRRWMVSAVAAAFEPRGVVARGVLTFVGKQNIGKTHWAKRLAPKDMEVIADSKMLNPSDKDSVLGVVSHWIVELGEVDATFRKADMAALKAFISADRDSLRRPYARTESRFARRTVFFASVNDPQFLHDPTGNSRWWTIHAESLDTRHDIDMQQVWAEVYHLYLDGESWHLTPDEVATLDQHNRAHESASPVHDMVDGAFDWNSPKEWWTEQMRATEIAVAAGIKQPTKKDVNEAAAYVVQRYGVDKKRVGKAKNTVWLMPPPSTIGGAGGGLPI